MRALLRTLCLLCWLPACSQNSLGGSVKTRFPLTFSKVSVFFQDPFLIVQYIEGKESPCKVSLKTTGLDLKDGSKVDGATFLANVSIRRVAVDEKDYAEALSGELSFDSYGVKAKSPVSGRFTAVFRDTFNVIGEFSGTVTEISAQ